MASRCNSTDNVILWATTMITCTQTYVGKVREQIEAKINDALQNATDEMLVQLIIQEKERCEAALMDTVARMKTLIDRVVSGDRGKKGDVLTLLQEMRTPTLPFVFNRSPQNLDGFVFKQ